MTTTAANPLEAVLLGSRDWVVRHAHHLGPGAPVPGRLGPVKRATELGLLAAILHEAARRSAAVDASVTPAVHEWIRRADELAGGPDFLRAAGGDGDDGLYRMQPYLWFRGLGHRADAGEDALRALVRRGARPRSVGVLHCLWWSGVCAERPPWDRWCRERFAAWRGRSLDELEHDGYRVTHAVLYATDLGARPLPLDGAARADALDLLHRLLGHTHRRERRDLTAELLLALALADHADPEGCPGCRGPAADLARHHRPDGSLPGTPAGVFRDTYHPTMVELGRAAVTLARHAPAAGRR